MLSIKYALCAETIIRDAVSNTISAITIFDEISAVAFPMVLPRLEMVFSIERDSGDEETYPASLSVSLGELSLFSENLEIAFQGKSVNRLLVNLQGLVVPTAGTIRIALTIPAASLTHVLRIPAQSLKQQISFAFPKATSSASDSD